MIKVLLFDFFGVISKEVAPIWFSRHFDEAEAKRLKAQVFERADLGLISEDESYDEMEAMTGIPSDTIRREFYELVKIDGELTAYIKELRTRTPVYLLSNASKPFLRNILGEYSLYSYFNEVFISSELGLKKPSPEYFRFALKKIGVRPEEAFFTDDNPENVDAARAVGIHAEVYCGIQPLKRALLALGIR